MPNNGNGKPVPGHLKPKPPGVIDSIIGDSVSISASNDNVMGTPPEANARQELHIRDGFRYMSRSVKYDRNNCNPDPSDNGDARWILTTGTELDGTGQVTVVWIQAKAGNRDTFGSAIKVTATLNVMMLKDPDSHPGKPVNNPPHPTLGAVFEIESVAFDPPVINAGSTTTLVVTLDRSVPKGSGVAIDMVVTSATGPADLFPEGFPQDLYLSQPSSEFRFPIQTQVIEGVSNVTIIVTVKGPKNAKSVYLRIN